MCIIIIIYAYCIYFVYSYKYCGIDMYIHSYNIFSVSVFSDTHVYILCVHIYIYSFCIYSHPILALPVTSKIMIILIKVVPKLNLYFLLTSWDWEHLKKVTLDDPDVCTRLVGEVEKNPH